MRLAMVLLTGAGLLMRSFWRLNAHPPGFDPGRTLVLQTVFTGPRYQALPQRRMYLRELLSRMQSVPGVLAAGVIGMVAGGPIRREGGPASSPSQTPTAAYNMVSPTFGRVLGMRLVRGRWLTDHESSHVVMVNETLARLVFGAADPIGRRLLVAGLAPAPKDVPATVVGLVSDLKYTRLDAGPDPKSICPICSPPGCRT